MRKYLIIYTIAIATIIANCVPIQTNNTNTNTNTTTNYTSNNTSTNTNTTTGTISWSVSSGPDFSWITNSYKSFTPITSTNYTSYQLTIEPYGFRVIKIKGLGGNTLNNLKWWNSAVFYQIFVRSFYDSNGDGKGDLQGIIQKISYLTNLGINAIWLSPINPSPSYHGYDVTDYYGINPDYGNMTTFQNLVQALHNAGVRIILDLVINHTSSQHIWFQKSASNDPYYRDWYVWTNVSPDSLSGWQKPWGGGGPDAVWFYNSSRNAWYYAAFWDGMPDLNYFNQNVRTEIKNIAGYWIGKGVDGYRLDAARYIVETGPYPNQADTPQTIDWWKEFSSHIKSLNPEVMDVGEVWTANSIVANYYANGQGLDMAFNFDFQNAICSALYSGNPSYIEYNIINKPSSAPWTFFAPFLDNHDLPRFMSSIGDNWDKAKLGAVILLTYPGTPFIYYGTEIGMVNGHQGGDLAYRTPMQWNNSSTAGFTTGTPWTSIANNADPRNVQYQQNTTSSLLNLFSKMIKIRRVEEALWGQYISLPNDNNTYVLTYLRKGDTDSILVVANFSSSTQTVSIDFSSEISLSSGQTLNTLLMVSSSSDVSSISSFGIANISFNPNITVPATENSYKLIEYSNVTINVEVNDTNALSYILLQYTGADLQLESEESFPDLSTSSTTTIATLTTYPFSYTITNYANDPSWYGFRNLIIKAVSRNGDTDQRTFLVFKRKTDINGVEVNSGVVMFRFNGPIRSAGSTTNVFVAGEFNSWNDSAWQMYWDSSENCFKFSTNLATGTYRYKYVVKVDWQTMWEPDFANPSNEISNSYNSILYVK